MAPDSVAPPELSFLRQSQKDSRVDERGEGRVEVLLQVLLQQALVRKVFLKTQQDHRDVSAPRGSDRPYAVHLEPNAT